MEVTLAYWFTIPLIGVWGKSGATEPAMINRLNIRYLILPDTLPAIKS
jgi:hypothetical protein